MDSCKSAYVKGYMSAYLAEIFVQAGVENVLAMSFNIANTMAADFLEKFYEAFIWKNQGFTASARLAREALRRDPNRFSIHKLRE